jgi:hypothetical protein
LLCGAPLLVTMVQTLTDLHLLMRKRLLKRVFVCVLGVTLLPQSTFACAAIASRPWDHRPE